MGDLEKSVLLEHSNKDASEWIKDGGSLATLGNRIAELHAVRPMAATYIMAIFETVTKAIVESPGKPPRETLGLTIALLHCLVDLERLHMKSEEVHA